MKRFGDDSDGTFELYYQNGWAWLTVYPPHEGGRAVYYEDIRNRMKLLGIPAVSFDTIDEIIRAGEGHPVALVEWPEGVRLAADVRVAIAEDHMSASVLVTHPKKGAAAPTVSDVAEELERAGVRYGIDRGRIGMLIEQERYDEWVEVARGTEAVDAEAAKIIYHFDPYRGKPYLELEFGRIDLKELRFIEIKETDDLLAELKPPVTPQNGRTVTDTVVYAQTETRPVELTGGENTTLSDDGTALYAAETGNVRLSHGAIIVEPVVTVDNVSYETGNIRHEGSVVITNDVADGFVVEATGDIEVGKGVGKATIRAGGNVLLKTGINGNGEGHIEADGNVFAKYVESSTVQARGHVFVQEAIMHSRVWAWRHCVLNGKRSEIVGSNVIVGDTLWCKQIGSVAESPVYVSVGIPPDLITEFRDTKRDLEAAQGELERTQQQLRQVEHAVEEGRREDKVLAAREQLRQSTVDLTERVSQRRKSMNDLRNRLSEQRGGMLVVENSMYKNVVIAFGTREYRVPEGGVTGTILRRPGVEIEEHGYNPSEPPELRFEAEAEKPREP